MIPLFNSFPLSQASISEVHGEEESASRMNKTQEEEKCGSILNGLESETMSLSVVVLMSRFWPRDGFLAVESKRRAPLKHLGPARQLCEQPSLTSHTRTGSQSSLYFPRNGLCSICRR